MYNIAGILNCSISTNLNQYSWVLTVWLKSHDSKTLISFFFTYSILILHLKVSQELQSWKWKMITVNVSSVQWKHQTSNIHSTLFFFLLKMSMKVCRSQRTKSFCFYKPRPVRTCHGMFRKCQIQPSWQDEGKIGGLWTELFIVCFGL